MRTGELIEQRRHVDLVSVPVDSTDRCPNLGQIQADLRRSMRPSADLRSSVAPAAVFAERVA